MTIRTVEQLYDFLSSELVWRRVELSSIRSLIADGKLTDSKKRALLRSGVTLLYAHREGFCKSAASAYIEFVAMQKMQYVELSTNFIALGLRSMLKSSSETNQARLHNELVLMLTKGLTQRSRIPHKTAINTQSNLSSAVLKNIIESLGLDYTLFQTKEKLIDEKLLKSRNTIAHGSYLSIDEREFLELFDQIFGLMDELRSQIDNAATLGQYKAS